ncbi:hypothetical protein F0562_032119 [Nyssa sinensis]|uniref:Uncharacterized protein n=1 Tax=Nyssa sinensis TaxID=561372 RepID=A0A5J5AXX2_9ASTE|nr:hypothetical protein F0562_032119 [Nyssa sinensis]
MATLGCLGNHSTIFFYLVGSGLGPLVLVGSRPDKAADYGLPEVVDFGLEEAVGDGLLEVADSGLLDVVGSRVVEVVFVP